MHSAQLYGPHASSIAVLTRYNHEKELPAKQDCSLCLLIVPMSRLNFQKELVAITGMVTYMPKNESKSYILRSSRRKDTNLDNRFESNHNRSTVNSTTPASQTKVRHRIAIEGFFLLLLSVGVARITNQSFEILDRGYFANPTKKMVQIIKHGRLKKPMDAPSQ